MSVEAYVFRISRGLYFDSENFTANNKGTKINRLSALITYAC